MPVAKLSSGWSHVHGKRHNPIDSAPQSSCNATTGRLVNRSVLFSRRSSRWLSEAIQTFFGTAARSSAAH